MSANVLERRSAAASAMIGHAGDVLSSILKPSVQLALWQRARPTALEWIDALDWDEIDDISANIASPGWRRQIASLVREAGYPQTAETGALVDELAERAEEFAVLMKCDRLALRLEVIETDACRKFHMDYVTARLLMPLVGPGTQWIDTSLSSEAPINQLKAGDVAIFKGRLAVEQPNILHRSPPVAASGDIRLLLAISYSEGDNGHSVHVG